MHFVVIHHRVITVVAILFFDCKLMEKECFTCWQRDSTFFFCVLLFTNNSEEKKGTIITSINFFPFEHPSMRDKWVEWACFTYKSNLSWLLIKNHKDTWRNKACRAPYGKAQKLAFSYQLIIVICFMFSFQIASFYAFYTIVKHILNEKGRIFLLIK